MGFRYVDSNTEVFAEMEIHDWEKPVAGELLEYSEEESAVYVNAPSKNDGSKKHRRALEAAYLAAFKTAWEKRDRKLMEAFGDEFLVSTDILGTHAGWDANESFEIGMMAAGKASRGKDFYIFFHGREGARLHTESEYADELDEFLINNLGADYDFSPGEFAPEGSEGRENDLGEGFFGHEMNSCSLVPGADDAFSADLDFKKLYPDLDRQLKETDENAFRTLLFKLIDERGLKDADVYRRAEIDRKLFSKIRCNDSYHPKKSTILALGIALELSKEELSDLLLTAGYALSAANPTDLIVSFCISRKIYSLYKVNCALYDHGQPILGEPLYAGRDAR